MYTYQGTVELESKYKSEFHYTIIKANSLEEAEKLTKEKFKKRFLTPRNIINIKLTK